jgi:MoaA/NifB/PqqE/SkfB family radical SAM enzyme
MTLENKVSAHLGLGTIPDALKELWLEIGASCHLKCSYCFAESGGIDNNTNNLSLNNIFSILSQFISLGGERIGIVGAGEPFHHRNTQDTFQILDYLRTTSIHTTIFTTGDLLNATTLDRLETYPRLFLLIKYNSQIAEVQDALVNVNGYTYRREKVMQELIRRGFNDGRLGIVTSILEQNATEFPTLFRYARDNKLIFDADTPIPRGRGKSCNREEIARIATPIIETLSKIDREEYGNFWEPHATYIASPPCTRFNQHLYVKKEGIVIPCVGAENVTLGNLKNESLQAVWEKPLTRIIRSHNYSGKCTTCKNYQEQKCFSCLGRCTDNLSNQQLQADGYVRTIGCFQYREK